MNPALTRKRPVDTDGDDLDRWLSATAEPPLDPGQRIIDPHHHLWDRRAPNAYREDPPTHSRYVADDLMHDIAQSGHHVLDTVYVECLAMYRKGNHPHASVGEIEFAQGVAATAASGLYGPGQRCCGGPPSSTQTVATPPRTLNPSKSPRIHENILYTAEGTKWPRLYTTKWLADRIADLG